MCGARGMIGYGTGLELGRSCNGHVGAAERDCWHQRARVTAQARSETLESCVGPRTEHENGLHCLCHSHCHCPPYRFQKKQSG